MSFIHVSLLQCCSVSGSFTCFWLSWSQFIAETWAKTISVVANRFHTIFQIRSLKDCKYLDAGMHNLSHLMICHLSKLLICSNLAGNQFSGTVPYSISTMPKLKYLWVHFLFTKNWICIKFYVHVWRANGFFYVYIETLITTSYQEISLTYFPTSQV